MLDFFSLGETFLGIGMRLGGGIMQFKMFGNLAHPLALFFNNMYIHDSLIAILCPVWIKRYVDKRLRFSAKWALLRCGGALFFLLGA